LGWKEKRRELIIWLNRIEFVDPRVKGVLGSKTFKNKTLAS
jgi:hypothetical protein